VAIAGKRFDVVLIVRETKEGQFQWSLHNDTKFAPGGRSLDGGPKGGIRKEVAPNALEGAPGGLNIILLPALDKDQSN
jgi:hypothetical protein